MKVVIIIICKMVSFLAKLVGRGSSFPGKLALLLDKNILSKFTLPENIIMVTGSNGKTSTTEIIANTLKSHGLNVAYNKEGSNQTEGVTTLVIDNSNIWGKVKKDVLVIESDERYTERTCKYLTPKYFVVTNLYRDQMTRNANPEFIYECIKKAINEKMHLVLNTDDPISSLYGKEFDNPTTYIGIEENILSTKTNTSVYNDGAYCPCCKHKLEYKYYNFNHVGSYYCSECKHERKDPDYKITDIDLNSGIININGKELSLNFKSFYNAYNVLFAYAVCDLLKLDENKTIEILNNYVIKNDRVQDFNIGNTKVKLLTSKHENTISYDQSINYILNTNIKCNVVILVDAISRKYFTSETSWLWDIDFEKLDNKNIKKIILAGKYSKDLMVRFNYIKFKKKVLIVECHTVDELINEIEKDNTYTYLITCFSDRMKIIGRR